MLKTGTNISKLKKIGKKEFKWTEHDLSHYGVEFFLYKIYETIVLAFKNIFVGMLFQLKFASFSRIFILSTKIYALSHPSSNIVFRTREKNHVIVENLVMKVCYQKIVYDGKVCNHNK